MHHLLKSRLLLVGIASIVGITASSAAIHSVNAFGPGGPCASPAPGTPLACLKIGPHATFNNQGDFSLDAEQITPGQKDAADPGEDGEIADAAGEGNVLLLANAGRKFTDLPSVLPTTPSACSVTGPMVDTSHAGDTEMSNNPFFDPGAANSQVRCGRAFGQSISISGCNASIELHGYVHLDHPFIVFLGTTTIDISFTKTGSSTGTVQATVFTPKGPVTLRGTVNGPIFIGSGTTLTGISSC
jgi:hypothetical protein